MTRTDMSEYQEKFSVTRLIGSPPGYVGYEEGGQLAEAVRHKPYSVVLFDEIEKAHPDVFNILLQVLDDGRLTDNKGRVVNFKNTIIIMTSNLGSHLIQEGLERMNDRNRGEVFEQTRTAIFELLRKTIRPEFLNRIDETIMFTPLTRDNMKEVVQIQFNRIVKRLSNQNLKLGISPEAVNWLASVGYDPQYGARPVNRLLQKYILNELSREILLGKISANQSIMIVMGDDELKFKQV
jgi:ATP-dependent Clp protease ATP-binding subunit ClpB